MLMIVFCFVCCVYVVFCCNMAVGVCILCFELCYIEFVLRMDRDLYLSFHSCYVVIFNRCCVLLCLADFPACVLLALSWNTMNNK